MKRRCVFPVESDDPRTKGRCAACGHRIPDEWCSQNVVSLLDRLGVAIPGAVNPTTGKPSPAWETFRARCETREKEGRKVRGSLGHLRSNNKRRASERAADGAILALFDHLAHRQRGGTDEDIDLVLTAAQKFYEAHTALAELDHKRHHAP